MWRCLASVLIAVSLGGCSSAAIPTKSQGESQAGLTSGVPLNPSPTPTARPSAPDLTPPPSSGSPTASAIPASPCDSASPVRVDRLNVGGRACFGSNDMQVLGWVAPSWGIGGTSTGVVPSWLGETMTDPVLWLKPRNPEGCFSEDDCVWVFVHVRPTGGVAFALPERWVEVTGHFDDPAAATCRWDGRSNPPGDTLQQAVDRCRDAFVVTAVRDTADPDLAPSPSAVP